MLVLSLTPSKSLPPPHTPFASLPQKANEMMLPCDGTLFGPADCDAKIRATLGEALAGQVTEDYQFLLEHKVRDFCPANSGCCAVSPTTKTATATSFTVTTTTTMVPTSTRVEQENIWCPARTQQIGHQF